MLLALLGIALSLQAQVPEYSRVKVLLEGREITELGRLGLDIDHGQYKRGGYFINDFSRHEIAAIQQAGFTTEILIADVKAHYVQQNEAGAGRRMAAGCSTGGSNYATPQNFSLGSMGGYFTYQEMLNELDSMVAKYPNLISARQAISNTNTHEGRPIYWVRLSDNPNTDEAEPEALYTALHHAREPGSLSQMIFFLWYVLENYATDPEIQTLIDNTELYFIPCVNPDGYIYNQTTNPNGGGLWRKNRRNNGGGEFGVDLNRNYGYQWGFNNTGSSPSPSSDTYRGTSGFSEPETQNVRDFCLAHNFQITLNYHTYGNLLVHPWGYNDQQTIDSVVFRGMASYMTRENNYFAGTGTETVGYTTNGDSDDWMYGETGTKNKIFSLTPEAGENSMGFWPPQSAIIDICKENVHQNLAVPRMLLNLGEVTDASGSFVMDTTGFWKYDVTRLGMMAGTLTVSATPLSANITSVGAPKAFNLNQFETATDSFAYVLDTGVTDGDALVFLLSIDNGTTVVSDTVVKIYGSPVASFSNTATATTGWSVSAGGSWGTTTSTFYSAPSCFADSPNGNYGDNQNSRFSLSAPITIPDTASGAILKFWAKWDIEPGYDYVQVEAATDNSFTFSPLCGKYTKAGNGNQDPGQPLYDGIQADWVQEEIDMSEYIGENVYLRFQLVSDQFVNEDGFFFDDIELVTFGITLDTTVVADTTDTTDTIGTTGLLNWNLMQLRCYPNPAKEQVVIETGNPVSDGMLTFYNAAGVVVYEEKLNHPSLGRQYINTSAWAAGVYYYQLISASGHTPVGKLVVTK